MKNRRMIRVDKDSFKKRITIEIDDDAFEEIKAEIGTKLLLGQVYGHADEFVILFLKSIDAGKNIISICKRKKGQRRTKV